ncbi:hypothetical protein PC39_13952 [Salinisphaera sp. PC39]|uniref:DUF1302 domain-containing protein n=1 Tax=Salinisphaera sp. PC39 TaxID=1304156 RepID=UPI00334186D0
MHPNNQSNNDRRRFGGGVGFRLRAAAGIVGTLVVMAAPSAGAYNFNWQSDTLGDFQFNWENRLTAGVQVRTESRDDRLIDKTNVDGQSLLCAGLPGGSLSGAYNADCQSRVGDPIANQQLLNARGGYNVNGDDGNLNYDRGDITQSVFQIRSELSGTWRNWSAKVSGLGYYDPTNNDFETHGSDLAYPNRGTSRDTIVIEREDDRHSDIEDDLGSDLRLLEAWVGYSNKIGGMPFDFRIGNQRLRWGESNLFNFNVLDRINPLSERLYAQPGTQVRDAFLPVGMATLSVNFTTNFSAQTFYQYDWEPTEPAPCGSYLSYSDVAACGDGPTPVYLSVGQYPEDPFGQFVPGGDQSLLDQGHRTAYLDSERRGYPDDGGQYGLRLNYYAENLNGGTELSAYAMNIHSRLPYLSADAADETCLQPQANGNNLVNNLDPCSSLPDPLTKTFPITSVQPFLDYPEDIHIYGLSGTTNMGKWSLAGEISYSPNQPAQVAYTDVIYAALQPAFPDTPANFEPGMMLDGEKAVLLPTNRIAVPDYLETRYRGNSVQAGDTIRGYERLKVGQIDMTAIRAIGGSNLINADQIIFVGEVAMLHVFDLPDLDELQFEGSSARQTHYSQGAAAYDPAVDGSIPPNTPEAQANCPDPSVGCRPIGPTDRINPIQADEDNFADEFAWGYRMRATATYNNALLGWDVTPGFEFFHDVYGNSISPGRDMVEDRKRLTLTTDFLFNQNFSGQFAYRFYWGGGYRNLRLDRDYAELSLSYAF